jgi:hypothetical protein
MHFHFPLSSAELWEVKKASQLQFTISVCVCFIMRVWKVLKNFPPKRSKIELCEIVQLVQTNTNAKSSKAGASELMNVKKLGAAWFAHVLTPFS